MYEAEYKKLVLDDFEKKLATGVLPPELTGPQRKSLRDHCIRICVERYQGKDEPLLESFFGKRDRPEAYVVAIRNAKAEQFRNLHNFLKDRTKGTEFINICLLAWMINFEPRPFHAGLRSPPILPPAPAPGSEQKTPEQPPVTGGKILTTLKPLPFISAKIPTINKPWIYLAGLLIVLLIGSYYLAFKDFTASEIGACMIWGGEQYKRVDCNYRSKDGSISAIPLDTAVLRRFKKIMNSDTLTAHSIGRVFCVKNNGQYDYFTDSAANPIYPERRLRPLTQYIMNNNR
jgi:hypothetical protein